MNPKEMTNEEFAAAVEKRCEFNHEGATMTELRRRLNEADALRNENDELRKDKARLDWILFSDRATGDELIEADIIGVGATPELAREMIDGARGRYNAARLSKESEVAHD